MRAGLAGLVERGFAGGFVVERLLCPRDRMKSEEGEQRGIFSPAPVLQVDNNRNVSFAATRSSCDGSEHEGRRW